MQKRLVSIIVPTHGGRDLTELINSVNNSTYKDIELIIVDENKERSEQRNIGIDRAKGEFFLFLDSDQSISNDLIRMCVLMMDFCDAIYIPEIIRASGIFGAIRKYERQFYTGTAVDVVRFVRAEGCPKFDLTLNGPEDSDWGNRVKGNRAICPFPLYHNDNIGIKEYFCKKAYYMKSMKRYAEKNPNDKILDWKWRGIYVFYEHGKWKLILRRPDIFIGIMIILIIRGVIVLWNR